MSFNYNHATLVGRLTRDPEFQKVNDDMCKATFTVAINRSYRKNDGEDHTDFVPISIWGKKAENCCKMLRKGSPVLIWGKIHVRRYEKDTESRIYTEVLAENFQLLETLKPNISAIHSNMDSEEE